MRNHSMKMPTKSVPVRQIIATPSEWTHALGFDDNLYLVPAVPGTYSYELAYCDAVVLRALGIPTLEAELLSLSHDPASKTSVTTGQESDETLQHVVGWRMPRENAGSRLFQILPSAWLSRVVNREQFLEVLFLDLWFRRSGRRRVVFRQTGQEIEALFLPSGNVVGTQKCPVEQVEYRQTAVYKDLAWGSIEAGLKARIASLTLSDLALHLIKLPEIGLKHEILKSLWFETVVNKVCFDQGLTDAMGRLFGEAIGRNHEGIFELPENRLHAVPNRGCGHSVGSCCG